MKISKKTLGFAAAALCSQYGLAEGENREEANSHVRFPNPPPVFKSQATWHEVCLKYNETAAVLVPDQRRRGPVNTVCDSGLHTEWNEDFTRVIGTSCPEGTVRALVAAPIAQCIQPMIL